MRYTILHVEKNIQLKKTIHNHIDEMSSIDLADMFDYKTLNSKRYR